MAKQPQIVDCGRESVGGEHSLERASVRSRPTTPERDGRDPWQPSKEAEHAFYRALIGMGVAHRAGWKDWLLALRAAYEAEEAS